MVKVIALELHYGQHYSIYSSMYNTTVYTTPQQQYIQHHSVPVVPFALHSHRSTLVHLHHSIALRCRGGGDEGVMIVTMMMKGQLAWLVSMLRACGPLHTWVVWYFGKFVHLAIPCRLTHSNLLASGVYCCVACCPAWCFWCAACCLTWCASWGLVLFSGR